MLISEGVTTRPIPNYPTIGVEAAVECKMATAILAQGNRLERSRTILRPTSEDKKVAKRS